jgi:hypothetical protein
MEDIASDSKDCVNNCDSLNCQLNLSCLTETNILQFNRSLQEHTKRGGFKRIFPSILHYNEALIDELTPENQLMAKWFRNKCEKNESFC